MTASVASFSSINNQHHLNDLSGLWDTYNQSYPSSSMPYATPAYNNNLQHGFSLDPTLQSSSFSSYSFVNPDCLQSQPQPSFPATNSSTTTSPGASPDASLDTSLDASLVASPVSSLGIEGGARSLSPATKTKRRRLSRHTEKPTAVQHAEEYATTCQDSRREKASEPIRRERNRNAAAKCRAKSKAAEEVLKDKQQVQRERNQILRAAFDELSNEVLALKHELLSHSTCNHPMIDGYLRRSADQISRGINLSSTSS